MRMSAEKEETMMTPPPAQEPEKPRMRLLVRRTRIYHMAGLYALDGSGNISALCYAKPHPIDLTKRQTWTMRAEAVTCRRCKRLLSEKNGEKS